jgi:DNA-binding winged helix-turn-helix (wHTH) protein
MNRASGDSTSNSLPPRRAPVQFATFALDLDGCSLSTADGSDVALTHSEFVALREFVCHPGRVLSRDYLLDALVGKRAGPFDRGVDVLVGRLRRKIEADPKRPRLIVTVPGEGYRFDGLTKTLGGKPSIAVPASPDDERLAARGTRPDLGYLSVAQLAATEAESGHPKQPPISCRPGKGGVVTSLATTSSRETIDQTWRRAPAHRLD